MANPNTTEHSALEQPDAQALAAGLAAARPEKRVGGDFRPEIQGLRTIAVMGVVLYHLWPNRLSGGYVGVDIFFVISGYLITGHMIREVSTTSSLALRRFWARRIRRLLPASFLVILASLVGVLLWVPSTLWENTAKQAAASALYVQNWILAGDSVDYSAQHNDATVVQHYWSLSVEEQFYLIWPLLIVALTFFITKKTAQHKTLNQKMFKRLLLVSLVALALLSLGYSIYATAATPSMAYFVTPTRIWEFAAGAIVAIVGSPKNLHGIVGTIVAWVGLAAILASASLFNAQTPFPGWTAAIPVLGTALVLLSVGARGITGPRWWLSLKPMTFIGDTSYAIYLWHWPLLIIAPYLIGHTLGTVDKVLILALTVLLSWLTKVMVEDPLRRGKVLASLPRTFGFALAGMAIIVAASVGLNGLAYAGSNGQALDVNTRCYGPRSLAYPKECQPITGMAMPNPGPAQVAKQNTEPLHPGCQADFSGSDLVSCDFGTDPKKASATVAIVGDSHATAWLPALEVLAEKHDWHIKTFTKVSCPVTSALRILPSEATTDNQRDCALWGQKVSEALLKDRSISVVFAAAYSSAYSYKNPVDSAMASPALQGFETMWIPWIKAGKKVVVFDDVPRTNGQYVPTCLASHLKTPLDCAVSVSDGYPSTAVITQAAQQMESKGVTRIPLQNQFCDSKLCYPQIGSVIVYRDYSHISAEYSRALAPFIDSILK